MENLDKTINDVFEGKRIFENVPQEVQPCWGAFILERLALIVSVVPEIDELVRIVHEKEKWERASDQFAKIRHFLSDHPQYQPQNYLRLAEKVAKITYNAIGCLPPFDLNSGWHIPKLAILSSFDPRDENSHYASMVISAIFMFERRAELRNLLQTPEDFQRYRFVDAILYNEWDPIGINGRGTWQGDGDWNGGDANWRDEYQSYAADVMRLYQSGTNVEALAKFLCETETETMGLSRNRMDFCRDVAQKILQ